MEQIQLDIYKQEMTSADFTKLSQMIYSVCGINLPDAKKILVESRIRKRMKMLGYGSYKLYLDFLYSPIGKEEELIPLIDVITTNKTDFFREIAHFEFLDHTALPEILSRNSNSVVKQPLQFWSAGCSTGEEPYTLAIVLNEYFEKNTSPGFKIYASDISTDVLKKAMLGVFEKEKVDVIPLNLQRKYLLKSKDPSKQLYRFIPGVRNQINFSRINFLDNEYEIPKNLNVIFCRNVLIYFDKPTQEKVLNKLVNKLEKGGYLLLGHSETIMGLKLPLERVASTIYKRV